MRRRADPTDWMWAHACDTMARAEQMHRQFFRLSSSAAAHAVWEPPADVFADGHEVLVVVALPGVAADRVEVASEAEHLVVRAERPSPFGTAARAVRQLEIPYGYFERRIALPPGRYEAVSQELTHGCLILRLQRAA